MVYGLKIHIEYEKIYYMRNLFIFLFLTNLLVISVYDVKTKKIPNRCIMFLCFLSVVFRLSQWEYLNLSDIGDAIAGALCVSLPMLVIAVWTKGGFGGGDIKLMAAGGLFQGVRLILVSAVIALAVSGFYILCLWAVRLPKQGIARKQCAKQKLQRNAEIAFAPFLSIGMAVGLLWGEQMIKWYENSPFY